MAPLSDSETAKKNLSSSPMLGSGEEIPLCASCGHQHVLGVKCHICGHVGRSQIFTKMRTKANEKRGFRVEFYSGATISSEESKFEVVSVLRKSICWELRQSVEREFSMTDEQLSYHVLGYVGDIPVAVARFKLSQGGVVVLHIDRFAVLPEYRQNRIAYRVIHGILSHLASSGIVSVAVTVTAGSWMGEKLALSGFVRASQEVDHNGTPVEILQCTFSQVDSCSLSNLMSFLQTKIKSCECVR